MAELVMAIEDEREIRDLIRCQLGRAGFRTAWIADGEEGLRHVFAQRHDAVVLDLMLPGRGGLEAQREARGEPSTRGLPVVVLTARSAVDAEPPHGVRVGAVLWAAHRSASDFVRGLRIDREEFSRGAQRGLPQSPSATDLTADVAWGMPERRLLAGVSEAVHEHGGRPLRFRRIERYETARHEPSLRVHDGIVIVAATEPGEEERLRLVHAVTERSGRLEIQGAAD